MAEPVECIVHGLERLDGRDDAGQVEVARECELGEPGDLRSGVARPVVAASKRLLREEPDRGDARLDTVRCESDDNGCAA